MTIALLDSIKQTDNTELPSEPIALPSLVTNQYIQASTSQNTRKAYRQDIKHFIGWGGLLPTTPECVVRYLHDFAPLLNPRTLARRLTALKHWHEFQGFNDPTSHPLIRKTLVGIQNIHGRPKQKAPALNIEQLKSIVSFLKGRATLTASRDNALIQVAFFGALRRSEVANLKWEHIEFVTEGMKILIPRSKGDQSGEGQFCAIPFGVKDICAVNALKHWQNISAIKNGSIFRGINRHQQISPTPLTADAINYILKKIAVACGLHQADKISGHSLRRGFATETSKTGASFVAIMRHGRWKHEKTVLEYIEEGNSFLENALNPLFKKFF